MATLMMDRPIANRIKPAVQAVPRGRTNTIQGAAQRAATRPETHAEPGRDSRLRPAPQPKEKSIQPVPPQAVRQSHKLARVDEHQQRGFNLSLPMLFILFGYLVGAGLVIMCGLDLLFAIPFSRVNLVFDIGFLISGALLIYLSWDARDGCR